MIPPLKLLRQLNPCCRNHGSIRSAKPAQRGRKIRPEAKRRLYQRPKIRVRLRNKTRRQKEGSISNGLFAILIGEESMLNLEQSILQRARSVVRKTLYINKSRAHPCLEWKIINPAPGPPAKRPFNPARSGSNTAKCLCNQQNQPASLAHRHQASQPHHAPARFRRNVITRRVAVGKRMKFDFIRPTSAPQVRHLCRIATHTFSSSVGAPYSAPGRCRP